MRRARPDAVVAFLILPFLAAAALAGGHLGEARDIGVDVQYSEYAYLQQDGPVYDIGTEILYVVTLSNIGNHAFKDLQAKGLFVWAGDYSCDWNGRTYTYVMGQPLPGTPDSGWRPASMDKGAAASFSATYPIPLTVCPGSQANLIVSARHSNNGQNADAGAFTVPGALKFNK